MKLHRVKRIQDDYYHQHFLSMLDLRQAYSYTFVEDNFTSQRYWVNDEEVGYELWDDKKYYHI